jgi:hypothetical protein
LKAPVKNKRALLDVGAAGPLAGLVFAIPILIFGLITSDVGTISTPSLLEGNSLFYAGHEDPHLWRDAAERRTVDVLLNQVAWAGWVGFTGDRAQFAADRAAGRRPYRLRTFRQSARETVFCSFYAVYGRHLDFSLWQYGTMSWGLLILLLFFFGRAQAEPLDDVTDSIRADAGLRSARCFFSSLFLSRFRCGLLCRRSCCGGESAQKNKKGAGWAPFLLPAIATGVGGSLTL